MIRGAMDNDAAAITDCYHFDLCVGWETATSHTYAHTYVRKRWNQCCSSSSNCRLPRTFRNQVLLGTTAVTIALIQSLMGSYLGIQGGRVIREVIVQRHANKKKVTLLRNDCKVKEGQESDFFSICLIFHT